MARSTLVVLALSARLSQRSAPTVADRCIAAQHEAAYRVLVRQQVARVWTPASGGVA